MYALFLLICIYEGYTQHPKENNLENAQKTLSELQRGPL